MEYINLKDCAKYSSARTSIIEQSTYISTENMLPNKGGISVVESVPDCRTTSKYEPSDILISNIRPYFCKIWFATREGGCSNDVLVIKANEGIDPKFLYYVLSDKNFFNYDTVTSKGTKMPRGNKNAIMKYLVPKIYLPTQQKIASILSTYDTLIENNTKRIRLLEQMAENLYKEWFVRFRFPGHENVEIEKGLPNGWKIEKVANWCRIFTGKKDVNQTKENGEYLFFSCSPNAYRSDEYIYDGKAILVAGNGSYTGRTRYYEGKFDLYQRTYAIVSNKEDNDFMFYLYNRFKFDFEPLHSGGTRGAAIPYIVMKDITRYTFLYNRTIVSLYIKHVKPMFKYIEYLQHQNQLLARQRDLLLPRLMSGKLEVKA